MRRLHKPTAYEVADAVLSGRTAPVPAPIDPSRREFKMCEACPRTFTRAVGETLRYCASCDPLRADRAQPSNQAAPGRYAQCRMPAPVKVARTRTRCKP